MRFCEYLQLQNTNNKYYIIDLLSKMKARDSKSVDTKLANLQKAIFFNCINYTTVPPMGTTACHSNSSFFTSKWQCLKKYNKAQDLYIQKSANLFCKVRTFNEYTCWVLKPLHFPVNVTVKLLQSSCTTSAQQDHNILLI